MHIIDAYYRRILYTHIIHAFIIMKKSHFRHPETCPPWALPWALPSWALPWALVGPCGDRALRGPGPWWGPAGIGPCGAPGPGGALRESGPAAPWALVAPCGDRALPWALPWALRGPCGDRALSGPLQIHKKEILPTSENIKYLILNHFDLIKTILKVPRPQKH